MKIIKKSKNNKFLTFIEDNKIKIYIDVNSKKFISKSKIESSQYRKIIVNIFFYFKIKIILQNKNFHFENYKFAIYINILSDVKLI